MDDERDEAGAGRPAADEEDGAAPGPEAPTDEPLADEPLADEPLADEPLAHEPLAEEPVPDEAAPEVHRWEVGSLGIPPAHAPPAASELGPNEWYSTRSRPVEPGDGSYRLGLGLGVPDDAAGWVTVTGLVLALASLLLPWVGSAGFLIGAPGSLPTGYLEAWGLGAASNWLPGILFVVAFALVLGTRRDAVRHGMVPLSVALFGLGNVWPYVAYATNGWVQPGVWLMFAGCVLAAIGAAIRLTGTRRAHA